jgi:predicted kinase
MSKNKLILTVGISGSGKSTWASKFVAESPDSRVEVNRDDIRLRLYGRENMYKGDESRVTDIQLDVVEKALQDGKTVVVSDTNLVEIYKTPFYKLANKYQVELELNDVFLYVPLDVCIYRDSKREFPVGESVIRNQYAKISNKIHREPYLSPQDTSLPKAVIFDVDGTMTLGPNHRSPYDMSKVSQDEPNLYTLAFLDSFCADKNVSIFILSGREEIAEKDTLQWINKYSNGNFHQAFNDGRVRVIMRENNNNEADDLLKDRFYLQHIKNLYHVVAVFDDRLRVCVNVWHRYGLPLFRVGSPTADF